MSTDAHSGSSGSGEHMPSAATAMDDSIRSVVIGGPGVIAVGSCTYSSPFRSSSTITTSRRRPSFPTSITLTVHVPRCCGLSPATGSGAGVSYSAYIVVLGPTVLPVPKRPVS